MRAFLILVGIVVTVLLVVGFFRGWFNVSGSTSSHQVGARLTVHPGKMESDKNKAARAVGIHTQTAASPRPATSTDHHAGSVDRSAE